MTKAKIFVLLIVIFILVLVSTFIYRKYNFEKNNNTVNEVFVAGNVMKESEDCTGDFDSEYTIINPYKHITVYIKSGDKNIIENPIIKTVTTDENGGFSISLKPGKYCAVLKDKIANDINTEKLDLTCYKEWFAECDGVLGVGVQGVSNAVLVRYVPCQKLCLTS